MKNSELFNKTVSILVKAYQNDTLVHGNCYACAVGNLVAANMGKKFVVDTSDDYYDEEQRLCWEGEESVYRRSINYPINNWFAPISSGKVYPHKITDLALEQINSTGYSIDEIAMIENAFEKYDDNYFSLQGSNMYLGLMSVVDCLMIIHDADSATINETKELFVKV